MPQKVFPVFEIKYLNREKEPRKNIDQEGSF